MVLTPTAVPESCTTTLCQVPLRVARTDHGGNAHRLVQIKLFQVWQAEVWAGLGGHGGKSVDCKGIKACILGSKPSTNTGRALHFHFIAELEPEVWGEGIC